MIHFEQINSRLLPFNDDPLREELLGMFKTAKVGICIHRNQIIGSAFLRYYFDDSQHAVLVIFENSTIFTVHYFDVIVAQFGFLGPEQRWVQQTGHP